MRASHASLAVLAAAAVAVTGCNSVRNSMGVQRVTPDEFRTVSAPPLTVPPEYNLRPPLPGQPRPQELAPESAARNILLGSRQSVDRSAAEQVLVARAGADRADPLAAYVIDDEFGDLAHKEPSFADRLMFWRRDDATSQAPTTVVRGGEAVTIDASTEYERLQALTGGQGIVIQRRQNRGIKLPGL
ncbi:MAG: DUF3035 domain-containing protein [Brevundimonas sp.]|jgi:hypothetical protein|uniref:DUF3035 domain-containing protein n=1 Tax=Brevundimonas sp. TaxID=1871086 RepID=UPI0039195DC0